MAFVGQALSESGLRIFFCYNHYIITQRTRPYMSSNGASGAILSSYSLNHFTNGIMDVRFVQGTDLEGTGCGSWTPEQVEDIVNVSKLLHAVRLQSLFDCAFLTVCSCDLVLCCQA